MRAPLAGYSRGEGTDAGGRRGDFDTVASARGTARAHATRPFSRVDLLGAAAAAARAAAGHRRAPRRAGSALRGSCLPARTRRPRPVADRGRTGPRRSGDRGAVRTLAGRRARVGPSAGTTTCPGRVLPVERAELRAPGWHSRRRVAGLATAHRRPAGVGAECRVGRDRTRRRARRAARDGGGGAARRGPSGVRRVRPGRCRRRLPHDPSPDAAVDRFRPGARVGLVGRGAARPRGADASWWAARSTCPAASVSS